MGCFSSTSKLLDNNSVFFFFFFCGYLRTVQEGKEEEETHEIGARISSEVVTFSLISLPRILPFAFAFVF
jgi:hypothetical protein